MLRRGVHRPIRVALQHIVPGFLALLGLEVGRLARIACSGLAYLLVRLEVGGRGLAAGVGSGHGVLGGGCWELGIF